MENEVNIDWNNPEQLRAAVAQFIRGPQTPAPAPSLPTGGEDLKLTDKQRQAFSDLWLESILAKDTALWTPDEARAVRSESLRVLAELGHQ
jgi:uncharacterized membrane protein